MIISFRCYITKLKFANCLYYTVHVHVLILSPMLQAAKNLFDWLVQLSAKSICELGLGDANVSQSEHGGVAYPVT